jgi:hypothetical protein
MPTVQCPVEGFEEIRVTYPDEWLMKHIDQFYAGTQKSAEGCAPSTKELYGVIALCEKIEGIDLSKISEAPLTYRPFFVWLVLEVYINSYLKAITIPNGSLLAQPTMQSE